jgi:hypothetical protein
METESAALERIRADIRGPGDVRTAKSFALLLGVVVVIAGITVLVLSSTALTGLCVRGDEAKVWGLNPCVKDAIQAAASIGGFLTLAVTAWGVWNELSKQRVARRAQAEAEAIATTIRREDLTWRMAEKGRELVQDIHRDHRAALAVQMLDWVGQDRDYDITPSRSERIAWSSIAEALNHPFSDPNPPACHIVDAFDWFLSYVDQIAYALRQGIVDDKHVRGVLLPYLKLLDLGDAASTSAHSENDMGMAHGEAMVPVGEIVRRRGYEGVRELVGKVRSGHWR